MKIKMCSRRSKHCRRIFFFWGFTGSTNLYAVIPKAHLWQIGYVNFPQNDAR